VKVTFEPAMAFLVRWLQRDCWWNGDDGQGGIGAGRHPETVRYDKAVTSGVVGLHIKQGQQGIGAPTKVGSVQLPLDKNSGRSPKTLAVNVAVIPA